MGDAVDETEEEAEETAPSVAHRRTSIEARFERVRKSRLSSEIREARFSSTQTVSSNGSVEAVNSEETAKLKQMVLQLIDENRQLKEQISVLQHGPAPDDTDAGRSDGPTVSPATASAAPQDSWQNTMTALFDVRAWVRHVCFHERDHQEVNLASRSVDESQRTS